MPNVVKKLNSTVDSNDDYNRNFALDIKIG